MVIIVGGDGNPECEYESHIRSVGTSNGVKEHCLSEVMKMK